MKYFAGLVSALAIGLVVGGLYLLNPPAKERSAESGAGREMAVRGPPVQRVSTPIKLRLSGELQPIEQVEIVSRLAGKVTEVRFDVGDFVPAGAIVATIRANDLDQRMVGIEGNVDSARQELRTRENQSAEAEKTLAQSREFFRRDWIPRQDVELAEIAAETARAQAGLARAYVAQQEAMLTQLRSLENLTRLSAPISGQVSRRFVETGAMVGAGTAVIAVANLDTLKLHASVSGAVASELPLGLVLQITTPALPGVISQGKIVRFGPQKSGDGTIRMAEIRVSNQQRKLIPGMLVEASIDLNTDE